MDSLEGTLQLICSSASFEYNSHSGLSLVLKAMLALPRNSDLCLIFLWRCADYRNVVAAFYSPPIAWPSSTSSGVGASYDLPKCTNKRCG